MHGQSSPEDLKQRHTDLLHTPLGIPGSGYTRYAAAMWLFQNGFITGNILEAYRICCKLDNEDPQQVAEQIRQREMK